MFRDRVKELRKVRAGDIQPNEKNWRVHSTGQKEAYRRLMADIGFAGALLAYEDGGRLVLIDGHMRQGEHPDTLLPVLVTDLTEAEALKLLAVYDPISAMATTNEEALAELAKAAGAGELLALIAADMPDLGKALGAVVESLEEKAQPGDDPGAQVDKAEALLEKWQVEVGDVWEIGGHRLLCGDSTNVADVSRVMGGEKADAVVTDPPYGIDFDTDYTRFTGGSSDSRNFMGGIANDEKPFDPTMWLDYKTVILWGANCYPEKLTKGTFLVWDKRVNGQEKLLSDGEIAWLNRGHGTYIFNHGWNGFLRESERGETLHPTQKPVELFKWCLQWTDESDIVLDPYAGSGACGVACEQLGRRCRMIELEPKYCAVILERMAGMGLAPVRV